MLDPDGRIVHTSTLRESRANWYEQRGDRSIHPEARSSLLKKATGAEKNILKFYTAKDIHTDFGWFLNPTVGQWFNSVRELAEANSVYCGSLVPTSRDHALNGDFDILLAEGADKSGFRPWWVRNANNWGAAPRIRQVLHDQGPTPGPTHQHPDYTAMRAQINAVTATLQEHGSFTQTASLVRGELNEERGENGSPIKMLCFHDGRTIIHGTNDVGRAKAIFQRYVGN